MRASRVVVGFGSGCGVKWLLAVVVALPIALFACIGAAQAQTQAPVDAKAEAEAIVGSLAGEAVAALRMAAWHQGDLVSPVLGCTVGSDREVLLSALAVPVPPRGASTWDALRMGRSAPAGASL